MRSMKLSPGLETIETMILSDKTFVPPVTELRSPPLSRITGADSPVIADSSTEAIPSTISPSPGMMSPVSQITLSPRRNWVAETDSSRPLSRSLRATVCVLVFRSDSACALPRPSAIASAKLANSTVNQSQSVVCPTNSVSFAPVNSPLKNSHVVMRLPISTTNITGFFATMRGSSLRKASTNDRLIISLSSSDFCTRWGVSCV